MPWSQIGLGGAFSTYQDYILKQLNAIAVPTISSGAAVLADNKINIAVDPSMWYIKPNESDQKQI